MSEIQYKEGSKQTGYQSKEKPEEKTILDEVFDWFHNWWYGQPEQTQHEGTSTTDEAGETTEVAGGGGTVETIEDRSTETEDRPITSRTLPRDKGTESAL